VLRKIGEDVTEVLEYVPSAFKVIQHVRPKLSCRACETIVQRRAVVADRAAAAGPGPSRARAVAEIRRWPAAASPERIYARDGSISIARPWPSGWAASPRCCLRAGGGDRPACPRRASAVTRRHHVQVLTPGLGRPAGRYGRRCATSAVRREDAAGGVLPYSPDRKGEHAEALLGRLSRLPACRRRYAGFNSPFALDPKTGAARLTEVGVLAHARRKLYDVP